MDTSSSSKVTVEYHDPSGVFPLVSRDINSRLPLRNLNWQSPSRPLRQIKSLHLDLVPDSDTKNALHPPIQQHDAESTTSVDIIQSGARKNAVKERRHQIPGLQTSPYLKIYVLRCDDKDIYKATERKKVRDWIKETAASNNSKGKSKLGGENHDAFEWLILHVVIPDTIAASQPRWREATSKDAEEMLKERKAGTKWPGKSTRTVFDKLRSDFNETGKTGQDRVAQIRLVKDEIPLECIPTPAAAETLEETPEEREKAWKDLMDKLKIMILGSFDKRVRQYETDNAEQESRRAMPGFNFCTFFIHKEGLAKALESIGLVEDALVTYDQLSLGLETVLRELANGTSAGAATTFAPFTDDIKDRLIGSSKAQVNGASTANSTYRESTESLEQAYREKIVRSNISVFDFFCYLFSRQKTIILRLANAKVARAELGGSFSKEGGEDLVMISEVCWRALGFIHNNARTLRRDLLASRNSATESPLSDSDVDSLVCCWTYSVASRVLDETVASALDSHLDPTRRESKANGTMKAPAGRPESIALESLPQRTTSLPSRKNRVSELQNRGSLQSSSENDLVMSPPSSSGDDGSWASTGALPGLTELITYRAELVMMQRKMLEQLAKQRGWLAGWGLVKDRKSATKLDDVDLNGNDEASDESSTAQPSASKLVSPSLASYLSTEQAFHRAYEDLSNQAMRYYITSTQTKSAESIMGDIAILKYQQGDFKYAVSYFQHVLPLYASDGWSLMEAEALSMHAKALKELDMKEEYVRTLLTLLAKVVGKRKERKVPRMQFEVADDEIVEVEGALSDLVFFSESLEREITSSALNFFGDIQFDPQVEHFEDKDGFQMYLHIHHLLYDNITLDHVNARLVSIDDPNQEIWLDNESALVLKSGQNELQLFSSAVALGAYFIDKIIIKAKHLSFVHEIRTKAAEEEDHDLTSAKDNGNASSDAHKRPWVYLFPAQQAFDAEVSLARNIHVDKPRFVDVKLSSGWNEIDSLVLKLKPASAGLRLHLADAQLSGIDARDGEESGSGQIQLGGLESHSSAYVSVPYSLEQTGEEIFVRIEARYQTSAGLFNFLTSARLPIQLPLNVDVKDVFHLDRLFSTFTIRTTGQLPLLITRATLEPSGLFEVEAPPVLPMPMMVFERQPAKLIYKITDKDKNARDAIDPNRALALSVQYNTIEELFEDSLLETLKGALEQSALLRFSRLLVPILTERCKSAFLVGSAEMALLLGEAKVPSFDEIGWKEVVATLPADAQETLTTWLKTWHESNPYVSIHHGGKLANSSRCINIPVEIPNVEFVHAASLSLLDQKPLFEHGATVLPLGKPVQTRLELTHTRRWSTTSVAKLNSHADQQAPIEFVYDIQADADAWLVGGNRRARFTARERENLVFEVLLIPLRIGTCALPQVDVQVAQVSPNAEESNESVATCETHYETAGQVVQVIRDLRTARVHIPDSAPAPAPRAPSRPGTAPTTKEAG